MTARAFLGLSDELRDAFAKAQDDETVRYLHVKIVNEDTLTAVGSKQKGADLATDFDGLGQVGGTPGTAAAYGPVDLREYDQSAGIKNTAFALCQQIFPLQQQAMQQKQRNAPPLQ